MTDGVQILVVVLVAAGLVALVYWRRRRRASEGFRSEGAGAGYEERPSTARSSSVVKSPGTPAPPVAERGPRGSPESGLAAGEIPITGNVTGGEGERPSSPIPHVPCREPIDASSERIATEKPPSGSESAVGREEEPACGGGGAEVKEQASATDEEAPESAPVVTLAGADVPHQSEPATAEVASSSPSLADVTSPTASPDADEAIGIQLPPDHLPEPPAKPALDRANGLPATEGEKEAPEEQIAEEEQLQDQETVPATPIASTTSAAPRRRKRGQREPRKYEGLARRPPQPRNNDGQGPRVTVADPVGRERALPIEVRLRFDRGGACTVSLIASRSPGLPEDLTVAASSGSMDLRAMQEEWYQDVIPERIALLLQEGAAWDYEGETGAWKWSLSGRELYVLAERPGLSGWVSQPCLKLGRKHAILCTEGLRPAAEEALRATGVDGPVVLDASLGSPAGWVVIRDVVPIRPVSPSEGADILNALRPLPEVEISLEGGIRLEYTSWLEGYPPLVRVYGDPAHTTEVRIDDRAAFCGEDGGYRVPGWDAVGTHTVWCEGTTKAYSIVSFEASWDWWDAYTFPVATGSNRHLSICGPLAREVSTAQQDWITALQLPETHTVVLGAEPGQCAFATRASDIRGTPCIVSPSFRPVWALPRDPLHCCKKTARIMFIGEQMEPAVQVAIPAKGRRPDVDAWCRLILDASRKGLATEPRSDCVWGLWLHYKRAARRIWRSRK